MKLGTLLQKIAPVEEALGGREVTGISWDSRTLRPGELFVALRGSRTDGHRWIPEARRKGCVAVVAEEGEDIIPVPDSRAALAQLSAEWFDHPAEKLKLVGVTGTNGKTTTTQLLWGILEQCGLGPVGLIGTNEVRIGPESFPASRTTPESYELQGWLRRMVDAGCRYAVMEVSSHALMLHRVDTLTFAVGAFTNLTQDHLDFHGTMEAYRQAKERLFSQSEVGVLDLDDETGRYYARRVPCPVYGYSERRDEADLTARQLHLAADHVSFLAVERTGLSRVRLGIPGSFSVYNALCALSCARVLGLPLEAAAGALERAPGVKGRMEVVPIPTPGSVIIDYAHTPDALEKALLTLRSSTPGRLICLFGCGGDRDRGKRPIMGAIAQDLADVCILTSDNPRSEDPAAILRDIRAGMTGQKTVLEEPDRAAAIALGLELLRAGDTLLLAGKGHETVQERGGVAYPLDERAVVKEYFAGQARAAGGTVAKPVRM